MPPRLLNREMSDALLGLGGDTAAKRCCCDYDVDGKAKGEEIGSSKITHVFVQKKTNAVDVRSCFAFASASSDMGESILLGLFGRLYGPDGDVERRRRVRVVAFFYILHKALFPDVELSTKAKEEWEEGVVEVFGRELHQRDVGYWKEISKEDIPSYGNVVKVQIEGIEEWYEEVLS